MQEADASPGLFANRPLIQVEGGFVRRITEEEVQREVDAIFGEETVQGVAVGGQWKPIPATAYQVGGDHYASKAIQPWDAMEAWMSSERFKGFLLGNAIKYLARCEDKGGIEDLRKAAHYLDKLIELEEGK